MTTKSLLSFQIHPNPSPKLISLLVIAGIYFLTCQSYRFPGRRRKFWKSSPGLDVRSLVAKSGQGKHSVLFWKVKEGFWSKALFSVYFCPFSAKSTIGDKIVETKESTPLPPPHCSKLGCLLFSLSSSISGTTLHMERMGKGKLYFPLLKFSFNIFYWIKDRFYNVI